MSKTADINARPSIWLSLPFRHKRQINEGQVHNVCSYTIPAYIPARSFLTFQFGGEIVPVCWSSTRVASPTCGTPRLSGWHYRAYVLPCESTPAQCSLDATAGTTGCSLHPWYVDHHAVNAPRRLIRTDHILGRLRLADPRMPSRPF